MEMGKIKENIKKNPTTGTIFSFIIMSQLISIFYFKYTQNSVEEKRHNRLFSINDCMYSYEDFITILHHIYVFGSIKIGSRKDLIKKKYNQLSNQLNYPYFSEDYLLNYFE